MHEGDAFLAGEGSGLNLLLRLKTVEELLTECLDLLPGLGEVFASAHTSDEITSLGVLMAIDAEEFLLCHAVSKHLA